jgi:methylenetetrahydrofolate reductase (NADPH)
LQQQTQKAKGWANLLSGFSLEVPISKVASMTARPSVLRPGSEIYLPHLSDKDSAGLKDACETIIGLGYQPVPHVGARHFKDENALHDHLKAARAGGAKRLLVLAGDRDSSAGHATEAMDILKHSAIDAFEHISVAGHPEGHPRISRELLDEALVRKLELLDTKGIRASITTQFGFDAQPYVDWIKSLRAKGIDTQINIGVAGITSIPSLVKYSVLCGVGPSLATLRKRSGAMIGLLKGYAPTELLDGLADAQSANELGQATIHFFPFGGITKTLDWVEENADLEREEAK